MKTVTRTFLSLRLPRVVLSLLLPALAMVWARSLAVAQEEPEVPTAAIGAMVVVALLVGLVLG